MCNRRAPGVEWGNNLRVFLIEFLSIVNLKGYKKERKEKLKKGGELCKWEQLRSDACPMTAVSQIPSQPLPWKKRYRLPITLADNSKT